MVVKVADLIFSLASLLILAFALIFWTLDLPFPLSVVLSWERLLLVLLGSLALRLGLSTLGPRAPILTESWQRLGAAPELGLEGR